MSELWYAVHHNDYSKALSRITKGDDVNYVGPGGNMPIHWACQHGSFIIVELLVKAEAFLDIPAEGGNTPLHWACAEGHREIVVYLLSHGAKDTIVNDRGQLPYQIGRSKSIKEDDWIKIKKEAKYLQVERLEGKEAADLVRASQMSQDKVEETSNPIVIALSTTMFIVLYFQKEIGLDAQLFYPLIAALLLLLLFYYYYITKRNYVSLEISNDKKYS